LRRPARGVANSTQREGFSLTPRARGIEVTLGMDAVMLDPDGRKAVLDALMAHHRGLLHGQPAARQG
jgi:hypothetical protein